MDWTEGVYECEYTNFYVREVPMNGYAAFYQDKNGDDLEVQYISYREYDMSKVMSYYPADDEEDLEEEEEEEVEYEEVASGMSDTSLKAFSMGLWYMDVTVDTVAASNGSTITITNKDTYQLPNSGGNGTMMFTLSGLAVMLAATGLMYIKKRRNYDNINREAKN
jgi:LPXTG-motif cell wall-anchored protein